MIDAQQAPGALPPGGAPAVVPGAAGLPGGVPVVAPLPSGGAPVVVGPPVLVPAVTVPIDIWNVNPLTGNFNPCTASGQRLFLKKTEGLPVDQRLPLTNSSSEKIMEILKIKEQVMGGVVTGVPTSYAGGIPSELKNIIYQSPSITIEMCQRRAFTRYSTPLGEHDPIPARPWMEAPIDPANIAGDKDRFYDRVNWNVVVELVKNILTPKGWNDLMLQQEKFSFYNSMGEKSYDGPTLLKVVIEEINPTASVNIELHRQAIEGAKLHQYKAHVVEMLKDIE